MERKFTLYVGLNDKDTKMQKISTVEALKIATNICMKVTDGCTFYEADGVYKHEDGTYVVEKTLKIELMFIDIETVKNIVETLKLVLNQESVVVQIEEVNSQLW